MSRWSVRSTSGTGTVSGSPVLPVAVPTSRLVMRWLDRTPAELSFAVKDLDLPGVEWSVDHTEAWLTAVPPNVSMPRRTARRPTGWRRSGAGQPRRRSW